MTKCTINENNEITNFWEDEVAPSDAVSCDKLPDDLIHSIGSFSNQIFLYKLVDGIVTLTDAGVTWESEEYTRDRQAEYPSIGDQLDMQYHDQLNGTTTWKDTIAKVKADNPKEAE